MQRREFRGTGHGGRLDRIADQSGVRREAVLGQFQRRFEDLGQRERSEVFQRRKQGVERRGHAGCQQALTGNQIYPQGAEMLDSGARRRGHVAVDCEHPLACAGTHQDRRLAADRMQMGIDDSLNKRGRDGGVDRVAAPCEHARAGRGRQIMLGRDHRAVAHHQWINSRHCG